MKKKTTLVNPAANTDITGQALQTTQSISQKMYRDHKICDHYTHGRVNKFPFGSSHGPICF